MGESRQMVSITPNDFFPSYTTCPKDERHEYHMNDDIGPVVVMGSVLYKLLFQVEHVRQSH